MVLYDQQLLRNLFRPTLIEQEMGKSGALGSANRSVLREEKLDFGLTV